MSLATGDVPSARAAADEIARIASTLAVPALAAMASAAEGGVLLAEGKPSDALPPLREAWAGWQKLDAPYENARVRVLIGRAFRALGDEQSAAMEFDAARWAFQQLGALPDVMVLDRLTAAPDAAKAGAAASGLTARELDVLSLLSAGRTNKEIGAQLVISEHTVARHVQNMLAKLARPSRAALAAFAVEHGLVSPSDSQE